MNATELLNLLRLSDEIIETVMRTWNAVRTAPAGTPQEVIDELDARNRDYQSRINRATERANRRVPAAEPTDERDPIG
jgi:hypothetical protein